MQVILTLTFFGFQISWVIVCIVITQVKGFWAWKNIRASGKTVGKRLDGVGLALELPAGNLFLAFKILIVVFVVVDTVNLVAMLFGKLFFAEIELFELHFVRLVWPDTKVSGVLMEIANFWGILDQGYLCCIIALLRALYWGDTFIRLFDNFILYWILLFFKFLLLLGSFARGLTRCVVKLHKCKLRRLSHLNRRLSIIYQIVFFVHLRYSQVNRSDFLISYFFNYFIKVLLALWWLKVLLSLWLLNYWFRLSLFHCFFLFLIFCYS